MSASEPIHRARLTRREALLFETGIKLGGIFHQYLGTPVAPKTARTLAEAIERAVRLQPYVRSVRVRIDPKRGGPIGRGRFGYRYLVAEMLRVELRLSDGTIEVAARLEHRPDLRYPLMSVVAVRERGRRPTPARRRARSAGRPARRRPPSAG
ncbi:MAG: dihydroneopterin aldolase family protein [Thermoplasmata archaeon]